MKIGKKMKYFGLRRDKINDITFKITSHVVLMYSKWLSFQLQ